MAFTPRRLVRNARALRRDETSAEAVLRGRRLGGAKFVRQAPVGPFVVDFLCREAGLVVEIDGATHSEDDAVAYDRRREARLAAAGLRVVRVQNEEVYRQIDAVLETILAALEGRL